MTDLTKPSEKPQWATDVGAAIVTPALIKQQQGWIVEAPPHQFFNWLHRKTYDWINYFEAKGDTDLGGSAESSLTIASGAITPTAGCHNIDTEGGAASDDLTNIITTNLQDGRLLLLRSASALRVITVKHNAGGAGQIALTAGIDLILSDPTEFILLKRTGANWEQVFTSQLGSDITPFLGGNLDVKSRKIYTSVNNGDVVIEPDGSGALVPETNAKALGSTSKRWNIWGTSLNLSADIAAVSIALSGHLYAGQIDATTLGGTLNIGDTNASLINIGRTGATIALYGSVTEVHTTNTYVSDKTITLNDGGLTGSGNGVGIEVEENGSITGYIKTSANRNKWSFLCPGDTEVISIGTEAAVVGDIGIVSNEFQSMFTGYTLKNSSGNSILNATDAGAWYAPLSIRSTKLLANTTGEGLSSYFEVGSSSYANLAAFRSTTGNNPYFLITSSASGITLEENGTSYGSLILKTGGLDNFSVNAAGSFVAGTSSTAGQHRINGTKNASYRHVLAIKDISADAVGNGGGILFYGTYSGADYEAAAIEAWKETTGVNSYGTSINFLTTAQTTGALTRRMTLNSNGYLGINILAPIGKLHIRTNNTDNTTLSGFLIENSSSGTFAMDITGSPGASVLNFRTGGGTGSHTGQIGICGTISCETNVGSWNIGSTTPSGTVEHVLNVNTAGFGVTINQRGSGINSLAFYHDSTQYGALIFTSGSDFIVRGSTSTAILYVDNNGRMSIGKSGATNQPLEFMNISTANPSPTFSTYIQVIVNGLTRYIPIYA